MNTRSFLLRIAAFIAVLGTGLTWTGLGYGLSVLHNDPRFMGLLQILGTITALLGPYLAVLLQKQIGIRKILVGADILSSLLYLTLFLTMVVITFPSSTMIVFFVTTSMLAISVQSVYFEPLYARITQEEKTASKDLVSQFSRLGSYMTMGKLVGMGCGSLLFEILGLKALFINFVTFFLSGICILIAVKKSEAIESLTLQIKNNKTVDLLKRSGEFFRNRVFLENVLASSLIYIVVLILSVRLMDLKASAIQMTVYWIGATGCALVVQTILAGQLKLNTLLRKFDERFGYLVSIPPLLGLVLEDVMGVIACQLLFSFMNPIARNTARAKFYETYGTQEKAIDAYGSRDFCVQIILLLFSLAVPFFYSEFVYVVLCVSVPLLILSRWIASHSYFFYSRV